MSKKEELERIGKEFRRVWDKRREVLDEIERIRRMGLPKMRKRQLLRPLEKRRAKYQEELTRLTKMRQKLQRGEVKTQKLSDITKEGRRVSNESLFSFPSNYALNRVSKLPGLGSINVSFSDKDETWTPKNRVYEPNIFHSTETHIVKDLEWVKSMAKREEIVEKLENLANLEKMKAEDLSYEIINKQLKKIYKEIKGTKPRLGKYLHTTFVKYYGKERELEILPSLLWDRLREKVIFRKEDENKDYMGEEGLKQLVKMAEKEKDPNLKEFLLNYIYGKDTEISWLLRGISSHFYNSLSSSRKDDLHRLKREDPINGADMGIFDRLEVEHSSHDFGWAYSMLKGNPKYLREKYPNWFIRVMASEKVDEMKEGFISPTRINQIKKMTDGEIKEQLSKINFKPFDNREENIKTIIMIENGHFPRYSIDLIESVTEEKVNFREIDKVRSKLIKEDIRRYKTP